MTALSLYNHTGFHTYATAYSEGMFAKDDTPCPYNSGIASGYLPVFGIFMGVVHICGGANKTRNVTLVGRIGLIARGILECIGCGILFLIPDLIVTMHRHCCAPSP